MPGQPLTAQRRAALFGKLPAHGDFVRRGDAALVQRLDRWLTEEVERLAAGLDDAYDARLAALPVWAFTLADGLAGSLSASHDRTGRVFPVVAVLEGDAICAAAIAFLLAKAQEDVMPADAVHDALRHLPDEGGELTADARWWRPFEDDRAAFTITGLPTGADFARLLEGAG